MISYFRIIAYHPTKNLSVIMDSNGIFERLWRFTAFMVSNGFKIIGVETEKKFNEGDLPKVEYDNVTLSFAPAKADHLKSWATASQLKGKAIRLLGKSQLFASGVLTCTY